MNLKGAFKINESDIVVTWVLNNFNVLFVFYAKGPFTLTNTTQAPILFIFIVHAKIGDCVHFHTIAI